MADFDYVETDDGVDAIDPGATLFLGTLLFCIGSLLALPIFVAIGNRRARLRREAKRGQANDVIISGSTSFDEMSADGCHAGCHAFEDLLEVECFDKGGGCCFPITGVNHMEDRVDEEDFDIRVTANSMIRKRKSMGDIACHSNIESDYSKRMRTGDASFANMTEQHSFITTLTATTYPYTTSSKAGRKRKNRKKRERFYGRAVRAITKKQPVIPLSQAQSIPKKSLLDGGFYASSNLRMHHQILQSQFDRERRADMKRKREKLANSYVPPRFIPADSTGELEVDNIRINSSTDINDEEDSVNDLEIVFGHESPYHPKKRKYIWEKILRIAKFDHESKRLVKVMLPYTFTALVCNMFAIIEIAIISSFLGSINLSAFLVAGYFLSFVYKAVKGFTDAQAILCSHAVGAGNFCLAGQYVQLTQIVFVLTGFLPLLLISSYMYQILAYLNVSNDVAALASNFAEVQVIALLIGGFNDAQMQFLSAIDPSIYSNAIEILLHASYTATTAAYLCNSEDPTLVDLAWAKCCVTLLFIPVNIFVLSSRGWLDLCWVGMAKSNALKNREAVRQMLKTGVPLGIGSLIRESEWGLLVLFASHIGTDDVATFAVVRRTFDIFSSLIEGLCCGAELRCAYHMGRGNQLHASRSAYKSLLIGISVGTAFTFSFYCVLGNYIFKLLDYDQIGAEMTQLIPHLCLCSIVMTIGMLGWALLGAQGRVRRAMFVSMCTTWIVTIPIAAYFVLLRNYNLQGLVAAVTVGYSVSSTIILYLFIRSNWKKRSEKVMRVTSFTAA